MYRYEPPNTPRVAFAFAAAVLATLTLAATVVWPAHVAAEDAGAARTIAARLNDAAPAAATGTVRTSTETTAATTVASSSGHVNCVDVIAGRGATG